MIKFTDDEYKLVTTTVTKLVAVIKDPAMTDKDLIVKDREGREVMRLRKGLLFELNEHLVTRAHKLMNERVEVLLTRHDVRTLHTVLQRQRVALGLRILPEYQKRIEKAETSAEKARLLEYVMRGRERMAQIQTLEDRLTKELVKAKGRTKK